MTNAVITTEFALDSGFAIAGRSFRSRLMVGTGKYRSNMDMVRAIENAEGVGEWPLIGDRFVRPGAIVSIDVQRAT